MLNKSVVEEEIKIGASADYKNPALSVEQRVADLLGRMTLKEKVAQMTGVWEHREALILDDDNRISTCKLEQNFKDGLGQIGRINNVNGGLSPQEMAVFANTLQSFFCNETRLGIPVIIHEECLHGLVAKDATSYPQPIAIASTFNTHLVEKIYSAVARDARSRGAHQALTPVVDVARDPRWGRVEETFGEDTCLVAKMGVAAVRGFQGDGTFKDKKHVIATLKHFAAHGQPESGSNCGPANISERTLRDTFLFPFKEAITKGGAKSVMPSYNEIDGIPSHANTWLLRDVLRNEWHFDGFIVSDYYAITEMFHRERSVSHGVAQDKSHAALLAAHAGVNIELPEIDCYPKLVDLVEGGLLRESVIDDLVSTVLEYKFKLGLFEDPYVDPQQIQADVKMEEDRPLALQAAHESLILLKNEKNTLPINKKRIKTLAVIGPNAERILLGGYSGQPKYYVTVLEGIKQKVNSDVKVLYAEGCKITVDGSWDDDVVLLPDYDDEKKSIEKAVDVAQKSDMVILAIGGNEQTSREAWAKTHLGDRANIELFGNQEMLLQGILKTAKPVVVLLFNGRPLAIPSIKNNAQAILECWYLGQETGLAVADVLFGDYNPGGKLPISFPRSSGHIPCYYSHKPSARRGYLFDDSSALFPFGFGKSYTEFRFDRPRLQRTQIRRGESVNLAIDIKNCGSRDGDEVVQLYIRDMVSSVTRPVKELKDFKRIHLKAGHTDTVEFNIGPEQLSFTNIDMEYTTEPGDFEVMVGNSSMDKDLQKVLLHVS